MLSCITTLITLIIFVLCAGKFSPSNKSNPPLKDFLYVHVGAIFYESSISSVFQCFFNKIFKNFVTRFFRYHFFWGEAVVGERGWLMLKKKNHKNKNNKNNKNTAFVRKEGKEISFGETKKCSAKMLVGEVVPRKITEEFTFVNGTTV